MYTFKHTVILNRKHEQTNMTEIF